MTNVNSTTFAQGVWNLDPSHSEVGFTVRHAGISKVRGKFTEVEASVNIPEGSKDAVITAILKTASLNSGDSGRDGHLKSGDFFDAETYPDVKFVSTSALEEGVSEMKVTGDLTIKGVTRSVTLDVEVNGFATDPFGNNRAGFEATTVISRKDFGLTWNTALETGGLLVGDKVTINLDLSFIQAV